MAELLLEHGDELVAPQEHVSDAPAGRQTFASAIESIVEASKERASAVASGTSQAVQAAAEFKTIELQVVRPNEAGGKGLVEVTDSPLEYQKYLAPAAAVDFVALRAFALTKGVTLKISEAWRPRARQEELFRLYPTKAAPPGTSKHEFGLAVDIDVGSGGRKYYEPKTAEYKFMEEFGPQFGFNVLKDSNGKVVEAWHWEHSPDIPSGLSKLNGLAIKLTWADSKTSTYGSNPTSSFTVSYALNTILNRPSELSVNQYNALRYGVAVSRAALAQSLSRTGPGADARIANQFQDTGLALYNPDLGVWGNGDYV